MSSGNDGDDGTIITTGPDILQLDDFYQRASLLHPIVIGSIAVIVLFLYLRLSSNRTIAPITVFDWIMNVAIGSTLSGIVNGNSLLRGLFGLITILSFQYFTSYASSHYNQRLAHWFSSPPLVVAFRGRLLTDVMTSHRISREDLMGALRQKGILALSQVECIVIEPTGCFSVFQTSGMDQDVHPEVLFDIDAYKKLYEEAEAESDESSIDDGKGKAKGGRGLGNKGSNELNANWTSRGYRSTESSKARRGENILAGEEC